MVLASLEIVYVAHALIASGMMVILVGFKTQISALTAISRNGFDRSLDDSISMDLPHARHARRIGVYASLAAFPIVMAIGLGSLVAIAASILLLIILPKYLVARAHRDFKHRFDDSLPDHLMGIASSLKAGLTIQQAFEVSTKTSAPEFRLMASAIIRDYRLGVPIDEAILRSQIHVNTSSTDIAFGALRMGRRLGGPLPMILKRVSDTIRERIKIEGKLRALTAQGRAQGAIICGMPIACLGGMKFFMKDMFHILTATLPGQVMLLVAFILWSVGVFMTWRIMQLEV